MRHRDRAARGDPAFGDGPRQRRRDASWRAHRQRLYREGVDQPGQRARLGPARRTREHESGDCNAAGCRTDEALDVANGVTVVWCG